MNFKQELLQKIKDREKEQTRRLVKPSQRWQYPDCTTVIQDSPRGIRTVYYVGQILAACPGRGKKQECKIEVVRLRREDVRFISDEDVIAEGFTSKYEFFRVWCGVYDKKALIDPNDHRGKSIVMDVAPNADYLGAWERVTLASRSAALYTAWAISFKLVK